MLFSKLLLLGLAAEATVATTWFSKTGTVDYPRSWGLVRASGRYLHLSGVSSPLHYTFILVGVVAERTPRLDKQTSSTKLYTIGRNSAILFQAQQHLLTFLCNSIQ